MDKRTCQLSSWMNSLEEIFLNKYLLDTKIDQLIIVLPLLVKNIIAAVDCVMQYKLIPGTIFCSVGKYVKDFFHW